MREAETSKIRFEGREVRTCDGLNIMGVRKREEAKVTPQVSECCCQLLKWVKLKVKWTSVGIPSAVEAPLTWKTGKQILREPFQQLICPI